MTLSIDIKRPRIPENNFAGGLKVLQGSIHPGEGQLLTAWAAESKDACVEIGSWVGVSTIYIARGLNARGDGHLHCIDPHSDSTLHKARGVESTEEFWRENVKRAGVEDRVTLHKAKSEEVLPTWSFGRVGLLFIDGDHRFKSAKLDFFGWEPFLSDDAIVIFHDTDLKGPSKVIRECVIPSGLYVERKGVRRTRVFRRRYGREIR